MPHNDKHYQKLLRTHKFVVKMVLAVLFVLGAGLSLMWLFDRLGGSFMSRGWQVFFIIVFAFLVAGLQIPTYIADIRKENWKVIDNVLKDWRTGVPISADQLTQTYQDLQARGQL